MADENDSGMTQEDWKTLSDHAAEEGEKLAAEIAEIQRQDEENAPF